MIGAFLLGLSLQAGNAPAPAEPCQVDTGAMLALGLDAFDQDMNGGWRTLASRPGCETRAADLIRAYRSFVQQRIGLLYWHEGQLRASAGETEAAIGLMDRSRHPTDEDGWNFYVDASIAFLRQDRAALLRARERLASLPMPDWARGRTRPDGTPVPWPMNLGVVDGFIRCLGRSYREAYGTSECRPGS